MPRSSPQQSQTSLVYFWLSGEELDSAPALGGGQGLTQATSQAT